MSILELWIEGIMMLCMVTTKKKKKSEWVALFSKILVDICILKRFINAHE